MQEEIEYQLTNFAKQWQVRMFNTDDQADKRDEFSVLNLKQFLRDLEITQVESKKENALFQKMIKLLTPSESKKPVLTCRNILVFFNGVFNLHEEWISKQDDFEVNNQTYAYKRRIWKYKMMVTKLQSEGSEALARSSKPNFEFLDDVTKE